jgi:hypothetical protein
MSRKIASVVVVLLPALVVPAVWCAAPPARQTAEQKAKLAERDRLEKQFSSLLDKKQYDKVLETAARIVVLGPKTGPKTGRIYFHAIFTRTPTNAGSELHQRAASILLPCNDERPFRPISDPAGRAVYAGGSLVARAP